MDALIRLAEEQTAYLERQFASHMPRHIISNGWEYFRTRKVFAVEVVEGNAIYGTVNGSSVYAVVLDADEFAYSKCTCPFQGYCKHLAAVFFYYLSMSGEDPAAVYERLTSALPSGGPPAKSVQFHSNLPKDDDGVRLWRDWFGRTYGDVWRQCKQSLHPLQPVLSEMKGSAKHWVKPKQRLHWLHSIEFVLEQAELAYAATESYTRYYYEMSFARTVEPWISHFGELAKELKPSSFAEDEREWLLELAAVVRMRAADPESTLLRWDLLYHVTCEPLITDGLWRRSEREKLEACMAGAPAYHIKTRAFVQASLARLDMIEDRDDQAVERLSLTEFDRTSEYAYRFAGLRLEERKWVSFGIWMDYLQRNLADCRNSAILRPFLSLCRQADKLRPEDGKWSVFMISYLPAAYQVLSEHWLETGKYTQWADLQLLLGIRPGEIDLQDLRTVTKADPGALIPLYHQAVEESVKSRNRQGYRMAVRQMKKLEKLYKSEGKQAKWNLYIKKISSKYARLRAFQEELWKGKIVK